MNTDNESPPGAWREELRARGLYQCAACGWTGRWPSLSDASELVEVDGNWIMDRRHVPVCPHCFKEVKR